MALTISSKGKSKTSESFQRQSWKNFEFCGHKNCALTLPLQMDPLVMPLQEGLDQGDPLPLLQSPPCSPILQSPEDRNGRLFWRKVRVKGQHCCPSWLSTRCRLRKVQQEEEDLPLALESLDLGGSPLLGVPSHSKGPECERCWGYPCSYKF